MNSSVEEKTTVEASADGRDSGGRVCSRNEECRVSMSKRVMVMLGIGFNFQEPSGNGARVREQKVQCMPFIPVTRPSWETDMTVCRQTNDTQEPNDIMSKL